MDDTSFDRLARRLERFTSRRGTFGMLAGAGVLSALSGVGLEVLAKGKKKKKKKKKKCKSESPAATCAGKCGSVKNNCKKSVECDSCPFCQRCSGAGVCEPDPDKLGDDCGSPGQICQTNGSCACNASSCALGTGCINGACQECGDTDEQCCPGNTCDGGRVCLDETCVLCGFLNAPCCSSNNCVPSPGLGCFEGICEECGGTGEQCCPNRICETGRVCLGTGDGTCEACGIAGQPCCDTGADCLFGAICVTGTCED